MSWKTSGRIISGPPSAHIYAPISSKIAERNRQNLGGLNAFQRERQLAARYGGGESSSGGGIEHGKTEWDILQENHRFIRDDEEPGEVSWEERLARAYESKLFKEFALVDLKQYKSKRFALRWRTAPEVVNGIGEDTCGSLHCKYHQPLPSLYSDSNHTSDGESSRLNSSKERRRKKKKRNEKTMPLLMAFELPFAYEEAGQRKDALVKVKLCPRCSGKLLWKPEMETTKEELISDSEEDEGASRRRTSKRDEKGRRRHRDSEDDEEEKRPKRKIDRSRVHRDGRRHTLSRSRSRSPRRRSDLNRDRNRDEGRLKTRNVI